MIIGIIGKAGSGKDTLGNFLISEMEKIGIVAERKKFAYKLKQIICLIYGCTMEDLESEEFKLSLVPEEYHVVAPYGNPKNGIWRNMKQALTEIQEIAPELALNTMHLQEVKMSFRRVLTYIGTDLFREYVHPDIWINALFTDYKQTSKFYNDQRGEILEYPNWIITDVRFKNEAEAVLKHDGVLVKIVRDLQNSYFDHISEKDLDDFSQYQYIVLNDENDFEHLKEQAASIVKELFYKNVT